MSMDAHQLDDEQLEYETLLRDIAIYGQQRRRARVVIDHMHEESTGNRALDHLFRSPIPVDMYLQQCVILCQRLEKEICKRRIAFQTLNTLWSQVVHLITRINRILTAGEEMKRQKFQILYWAESIRERVERQEDPNREFLPAVEIEARYQRIRR